MNETKGTVIDPYCGSGTTLVAAKLLGHDYIGIDASKPYLDMTAKRIKNSETERGIWEQEKELHMVQESAEVRRREGKHVGKFSPLKQSRVGATVQSVIPIVQHE